MTRSGALLRNSPATIIPTNGLITSLIVLAALVFAFRDSPAASTTQVYFVHSNHLGAPQFVTDEDAVVLWNAGYEPFGQISLPTEAMSNNLRLPGQYFDAETGLHFNLFRDYDPTLGRYIESEPIGVKGLIEAHRSLLDLEVRSTSAPSLSTYAYAFNNPVNTFDPDGRAGRTTIEQAVINAVLRGNKSELNFVLEHVAKGRFSPAKAKLLRRQCDSNAEKIRAETLDIRDAEIRLVNALERAEDAALGKPQPRTRAERLVEALRAIISMFD